jgi:hypothetical protein
MEYRRGRIGRVPIAQGSPTLWRSAASASSQLQCPCWGELGSLGSYANQIIVWGAAGTAKQCPAAIVPPSASSPRIAELGSGCPSMVERGGYSCDASTKSLASLGSGHDGQAARHLAYVGIPESQVYVYGQLQISSQLNWAGVPHSAARRVADSHVHRDPHCARRRASAGLLPRK